MAIIIVSLKTLASKLKFLDQGLPGRKTEEGQEGGRGGGDLLE